MRPLLFIAAHTERGDRIQALRLGRRTRPADVDGRELYVPFIPKLERCDYVQVPAVQVRLAPQLAPQHGFARPPHAMQYDVIPLETHV